MPTLDWLGKAAVVDHHRRVPFHLLRDVPEMAGGDPAAGNLIVEGDNLKALKALLPYYAGRVKCIYIDPPYNTGNEGWAYNDNVNSPEIRHWLGDTVGKEAEDLSRHDKWLCMMYPRLALLREMLTEDGSIWISLDDNEVHHARALLDEIFGANNFVATVIWEKVYAPKNSAQYLSEDHDFILIYAHTKLKWSPNLLSRSEDQNSIYSNPDDDPRGEWASDNLTARNPYSLGTYSVTTPSGRIIPGPPKGTYWRVSKEKLQALDNDGRIWWGESGRNAPRLKRFLREVKQGIVPQTLWTYQEVGHTQEAKRELIEICDFESSTDVFITPKPTRLIQRVLQIATGPDDIVMDAYAGSGTTGHAVLKQNAADGGNRRFVLVEIEEEVARNVTSERVRRAVEGYAFSGNDREELLREKVTFSKLKQSAKLLGQIDHLRTKHKDRFDKFETKLKDDHLTLTGVRKIEERKEGLGSGFRYARLGPAVFDAEGRIDEEVGYEDFARFVFFLATGSPMEAPPAEPPFLGAADGVGVYLLYNGILKDRSEHGGNVLTRALLDSLPPYEGRRIVYGAATMVAPERLQAANVEFRQIPYAFQTES